MTIDGSSFSYHVLLFQIVFSCRLKCKPQIERIASLDAPAASLDAPTTSSDALGVSSDALGEFRKMPPELYLLVI